MDVCIIAIRSLTSLVHVFQFIKSKINTNKNKPRFYDEKFTDDFFLNVLLDGLNFQGSNISTKLIETVSQHKFDVFR